MQQQQIIEAIRSKYKKWGENPDTYLKGLLQAKPINYWDYVEVDTLLSLQKPRTGFPDEEIFIMYHQVTELLLKLMIHEIKQVVYKEDITEVFLIGKLRRMSRYTKMLISSFDVMREGMDYDDYTTFRVTLAPASGFQSAQFRLVEIYCTRIVNLINEAGKVRLSAQPDMEEYFEHIYWKDAGMNRQTGEKTLTLRQFEEKYQERFIALAKKVRGRTIEEIAGRLKAPSDALQDALREFDRLYNIEWPLVHLNTARHYLDKKGENQAATGGSEWKKYLHPQFQQRKFFPALWAEAEIKDWGLENIKNEGHVRE
jgi:tryptophan 2,3-dioxygenase